MEWILILCFKSFDRIYRIVRIFFISSFLKKLEIRNSLSAKFLRSYLLQAIVIWRSTIYH